MENTARQRRDLKVEEEEETEDEDEEAAGEKRQIWVAPRAVRADSLGWRPPGVRRA